MKELRKTARERTVLWSAGFSPKAGSKAQGIGWQEEKAACLRTFNTGGVLIVKRRKRNDVPKEDGNAVSGSAPRQL